MPATAAIDAEHLTKLAAKIAKRIWKPGVSVDLEDLIQEGVSAGLRALPKFDPSRGVAIGTFLYQRVRGGILDTFRKPGAVLIRTPRSEPRVMVTGDHGETPLAELAVDRGGIDALYTPAPPDTSALSRQQRRLVRLLYHKGLSREQAAAKLRVSLDRLDEMEHEVALLLRSTQEVPPTEEETDLMIALAGKHESATKATASRNPGKCPSCHNERSNNFRCWTPGCTRYGIGDGKKVGKGKKKAAGNKARNTSIESPAPSVAPPPQPAVVTPTVGPAELTALADVTRVLVSLSAASRVAVVAWIADVFGAGA